MGRGNSPQKESMKTIELKTVEFQAYGNKSILDYKALLQAILESPLDPTKGTSIGEIRRSVRVLDAIDNMEESLQLEDADFEYMLERIRNAKFTSNNQVFIDFVDYFENFQN